MSNQHAFRPPIIEYQDAALCVLRGEPLHLLMEDFLAALAWVESFGIDMRRTRFGTYLRHLKQVLGKSATIPERVATLQENGAAILEIKDVVEVHRSLRNYDATRLRTAFASIARGTELYADENPARASNAARNKMFELLVAGQMIRGGLTPDISGIGDVLIDLPSGQLVIECKRAQTEGAVANLYRGGAKQVSRRGIPGLVALDMTKAMNPAMVSPHRTEREITARVQGVLDWIRHRHADNCRRVSTVPIGTLYRFHSSSVIPDQGVPTCLASDAWGFWHTIPEFVVAGDTPDLLDDFNCVMRVYRPGDVAEEPYNPS